MSVPNQISVKIGPREPWNKEYTYGRFHNEAMSLACKNLTGGEFQLWCYINANQDDYEFELSQKACENWGISPSTYKRAKKELITKGYLTPSRDNANLYIFHETVPDHFGPV